MIKAMIVEDEVWVRKGIIKVIKWEELGLELAGEAENGEKALELLKREKPEIVITDMKMPRYSGVEFLKKVIETGSKCEIIVISGYSDYEYMKQAITSGVFEYILKPVDENYLNDVLRNAIGKLEANRLMESKLEAGKLLFADKVLHTLVADTPKTDEELLMNAKVADINLDYTLFSIVIIYSKSEEFTRKENATSLNYSFMEMAANAMQSENSCFICNVFKNPLAAFEIVILCKSKSTNRKSLIDSQRLMCERLMQVGTSVFNLDLRFGVGSWFEGLRNIRKSFEEAAAALKYQVIAGKDILFYPQIIEDKDSSMLSWKIDENQLESILRCSAGNEVFGVLKNLFDVARKKRYCNISALREALIEFIMAVERCVLKQHPEIKKDILFETGYIERTELLTTIDSLQEWASEILRKAFVIIGQPQERDKGKVVQLIKDYIDLNYSEDINLISMAQKFYMNHIYLSRLFKAQSGENFIDYLTRVRMEKARELLASGQLKIKDVSEAVGYNNQYYFAKSYRKYFGHAPSEK